MVTAEKARLIAIQDRLIELYVEQREAEEAHNWHRSFVMEIAINCAKTELTELRHCDSEKEL